MAGGMCRRPSQNQSQSTFASVLVGSDVTVDREREKRVDENYRRRGMRTGRVPACKRRLFGIGHDPSFVDEGF